MAIFTTVQREQLRSKLASTAKADTRLIGAAHTGSAAIGLEDRWSDIDLALCLAPKANLNEVLTDWTNLLYQDGAVAHHDVRRGPTLFRVFLLENTLQVDLAFWSATDFAPIGRAFV
jgi:hypothetical protein